MDGRTAARRLSRDRGVFQRAAHLIAAVLLILVPVLASAALTIDAPPQLRVTADRLRSVDLAPLDDALRRAGLALPDDVRVTLISGDDARGGMLPDWIVGLAFGERDIVIFPSRVVSYPYDSIESVLRHEMTHLALNAAAGGRAKRSARSRRGATTPSTLGPIPSPRSRPSAALATGAEPYLIVGALAGG